MWRGETGLSGLWALPGESEEDSWARNQQLFLPQGVAQTPADMGQMVVYLVCASHVTGQALAVDGGFSLELRDSDRPRVMKCGAEGRCLPFSGPSTRRVAPFDELARFGSSDRAWPATRRDIARSARHCHCCAEEPPRCAMPATASGPSGRSWRSRTPRPPEGAQARLRLHEEPTVQRCRGDQLSSLRSGGHAVAALTVPYVTRLDDRDGPPAEVAQAALAGTVAQLNSALGSKGMQASGPQPT